MRYVVLGVMLLGLGWALPVEAEERETDAPPQQPAGLSGALVHTSTRWQKASASEGPLLGFLHVLTNTDRPTAPPPTPAPTKDEPSPPPPPLTFDDYLNQSGDASTDDAALLRYGF